ncbi:MAG: Uncharacterised protein [Halieaceae bacterium]|nr:MAG: Uncharacterised protein [Halieaceae bacterium]
MRQLCSRIGQHRLISVPFVIQIQRVVPAAKRHALDAAVGSGNLPRSLYPCCRFNDRHQVQAAHSHTLRRLGSGEHVFQLVETRPRLHLWQHHTIEPWPDGGFDVLGAIRRIDAIDANVVSGTTVGTGGESIHHALTRSGLFTDCHSIFQIQDDGIGAHLKNLFHAPRMIRGREQETPNGREIFRCHISCSRTSDRRSASRG